MTTKLVTSVGGALQYRAGMDDALGKAIEQTDLPALVGHYYPDSGAEPGRKDVVFAVWRGDERASFSLFRGDGGTWLYRDHRTRETGNAFGFLTNICGLTKAEAAAQLKAGTWGDLRSVPGSRPVRTGHKPLIRAGDAVYDALWRAVNENRVVGFTHPLSQAVLSKENALVCVRSALETPSRDSQKILEAAHAALKEVARKKKALREGKPIAYYDYTDERGRLLYQVVRFSPNEDPMRAAGRGASRRTPTCAPRAATWSSTTTHRTTPSG